MNAVGTRECVLDLRMIDQSVCAEHTVPPSPAGGNRCGTASGKKRSVLGGPTESHVFFVCRRTAVCSELVRNKAQSIVDHVEVHLVAVAWSSQWTGASSFGDGK
jgi:hypothetical protein